MAVAKCKGVCALRDRRRPDDAGAAAVEFALLLPLFTILVFGIISGGIVFNDKLALSQGVREAARYGATLQTAPADATAATTFLKTVRSTAQGDAYGQMGTGAATYCVGFVPATTGKNHYYLTNDASDAQIGDCPNAPGVQAGSVVVVGQKPASFNLILAKYDTTMTSVAVARFESPS